MEKFAERIKLDRVKKEEIKQGLENGIILEKDAIKNFYKGVGDFLLNLSKELSKAKFADGRVRDPDSVLSLKAKAYQGLFIDESIKEKVDKDIAEKITKLMEHLNGDGTQWVGTLNFTGPEYTRHLSTIRKGVTEIYKKHLDALKKELEKPSETAFNFEGVRSAKTIWSEVQ